MSKFLIMCAVLYLINKIVYWHDNRKSNNSNTNRSEF